MKWQDYDTNKNAFPETIRIIVDWLWFISPRWSNIQDKNKFIEQNLQPLITGSFRNPTIENGELKFPSPALGTFIRNLGFIDNDYNISELLKLVAQDKLTITEYSLIILSKHRGWVNDKPIVNFLVLLCLYLQANDYCNVSIEMLEKLSMVDGYALNPTATLDKNRNDLLYNYIKAIGLFEETNDRDKGRFLTIKDEAKEIIDFIASNKDVIKVDYRIAKNDKYIYYGDLTNGIFMLDGIELPSKWRSFYPNLLNPNNHKYTSNYDGTYRTFTTALRTKPFLLLAGISGTGKSRIVREFAFKSCPKYLQDKDGTTPGNYCMIEVKPNWHDSTELLGYYSNLSKNYQFKKFVMFLVKAKMFPDVPFFVCLDEMNLAPVEQYFAEILSILETRKHPKTDGAIDLETIKTGVIVEAKHFRNLSTISNVHDKQTGVPFDQKLTDRDIYMKLFNIDTETDIKDEVRSRTELTTTGLTLPDNVVIIGTVNMDDTTHQFSRKVIDRAMTIEMNGGKLADMFGGSNNLEYIEDEEEQKKWQNAFSQRYVTADEVLEAHPEYAEKIKKELPTRLEEINKALKGTPFEVSYRVLNELTIMVGVMLDDNDGSKDFDIIINQAINNILLMKILPRIEGDAEMFALSKAYKDDNGNSFNNRLEWLKTLAPDIENSNPQTAKEKIQEMIDRLNNQDFTRFWP